MWLGNVQLAPEVVCCAKDRVLVWPPRPPPTWLQDKVARASVNSLSSCCTVKRSSTTDRHTRSNHVPVDNTAFKRPRGVCCDISGSENNRGCFFCAELDAEPARAIRDCDSPGADSDFSALFLEREPPSTIPRMSVRGVSFELTLPARDAPPCRDDEYPAELPAF
jgi:hypothetical protein